MKKSLFILSFFIITSCVTTKTLPGRYVSKGKDYYIDLTLNKDGSFTFTNEALAHQKNGRGAWQILGADTILLKFKDLNPYMGITQNYVSGERLKLVRMKNGKLKYIKAVLKKTD